VRVDSLPLKRVVGRFDEDGPAPFAHKLHAQDALRDAPLLSELR
jgi:hypothetical protein